MSAEGMDSFSLSTARDWDMVWVRRKRTSRWRISPGSPTFFTAEARSAARSSESPVVIINPVLKTDFRSYIKQNGGMLAKGWLLGIQFYTLFRDGLYFKITQEADRQAMRIRQAFRQKGIPFFVESPTNQQFVVVKNSVAEKLAEKYIYEFEQKIDEDHCCIRFCTSWSTPEEDVEALIRDIADL